MIILPTPLSVGENCVRVRYGVVAELAARNGILLVRVVLIQPLLSSIIAEVRSVE